MKLLKDIIIQDGTTNDRTILLNLKHDHALGIGKHVVYIYSLVGEEINYPNRSGKILYIGEACRKQESTGARGLTGTGPMFQQPNELGEALWRGISAGLFLFCPGDRIQAEESSPCFLGFDKITLI